MKTHVQIVPLQGVSLGFLYWNSDIEGDYEEGYFEERYQFMFLVFGLIITRWDEQY